VNVIFGSLLFWAEVVKGREGFVEEFVFKLIYSSFWTGTIKLSVRLALEAVGATRLPNKNSAVLL